MMSMKDLSSCLAHFNTERAVYTYAQDHIVWLNTDLVIKRDYWGKGHKYQK